MADTIDYRQLAIKAQGRTLARLLRAVRDRPALSYGATIDGAAFELARSIAHQALQLRPDLCPGWQARY